MALKVGSVQKNTGLLSNRLRSLLIGGAGCEDGCSSSFRFFISRPFLELEVLLAGEQKRSWVCIWVKPYPLAFGLEGNFSYPSNAH